MAIYGYTRVSSKDQNEIMLSLINDREKQHSVLAEKTREFEEFDKTYQIIASKIKSIQEQLKSKDIC